MKPLALGKVHLRSKDPYDLPIIQSKYLGRREDVTTLVKGIQLARRFLQTTAFQDIDVTEIVLPMPECETVSIEKTTKNVLKIEINQITKTQIEDEK